MSDNEILFNSDISENVPVSENEDIRSALIKFNNSYLRRFASLDKSLKDISNSVELLGSSHKNSNKIEKIVGDSGHDKNYGFKFIETITKKISSFQSNVSEFDNNILNSFRSFLDKNKEITKHQQENLGNIESTLGEVDKTLKETAKLKKQNGLLDLIFGGLTDKLTKGFDAVKSILSSLTSNLFTSGILVRAFGPLLLAYLGLGAADALSKKFNLPKSWEYTLKGGIAGAGVGFVAGGPVGAGLGFVAGGLVGWGKGVVQEYKDYEEAKQKNPLGWFKENVISKSEGTSGAAGYNTTVYNLRDQNLTEKSLAEILEIQEDLTRTSRAKGLTPSSAVGKYQVMRKTLLSAMRPVNQGGLGLTRNDKFDIETQEKIANWLLNYDQLDSLLTGKITPEKFAQRISGTWEGLQSRKGKFSQQELVTEVKNLKSRMLALKSTSAEQESVEIVPNDKTLKQQEHLISAKQKKSTESIVYDFEEPQEITTNSTNNYVNDLGLSKPILPYISDRKYLTTTNALTSSFK